MDEICGCGLSTARDKSHNLSRSKHKLAAHAAAADDCVREVQKHRRGFVRFKNSELCSKRFARCTQSAAKICG